MGREKDIAMCVDDFIYGNGREFFHTDVEELPNESTWGSLGFTIEGPDDSMEC